MRQVLPQLLSAGFQIVRPLGLRPEFPLARLLA
jgi:hypothetical protein